MNKLEKFASECQMAADEMAVTLIQVKDVYETLTPLQSICDFNLVWLYGVAPEVVLHLDSMKWLKSNIEQFKRKVKLTEVLHMDYLIKVYNPDNINELRELIK